MDITLFISRFLYRIRYQIILGSLVVTALVAYFSKFLPRTYTVTTSIYTGIAYNSTLDTDQPNTVVLNNTFDNLINLTQAKGTLENVSMNLFALSMIHGNAEEDNIYITASHYRDILKITPDEVKALIDRDSFDKTIENLQQYKSEDPQNFLFWLFNWSNPYYSYKSLQKTSVTRLANSDLVEISYEADDPGIALSTVRLIHDELVKTYDGIQYRTVNDIVKHYEEELDKVKKDLNIMENELTEYNIEHGVINYQEQTKALTNALSGFNDRYEIVLKEYESSMVLVKSLEEQMETRGKLFRANNEFIDLLNELSTINGQITELEIFGTGTDNEALKALEEKRIQLRDIERKIAEISDQMDEYKYSKEGVAIEELVSRWLEELIKSTRTKAELDVMNNRREEFIEEYKMFSPVGTQLNRREREIRITEQSYLEILHALNLAKLKQKNIQLSSSNLNTISPPTFPLTTDRGKRMLFTIASFLGSIIFIIGCNLIIELLDRTLRDAERTRRLTNMPVLGAFTGNVQLKYRGYIKACNRISATYMCNRLNSYIQPGKTLYINILSIEDREGKSFVSQYLLDQWENQGLKARHLVINEEITLKDHYLQATSFESLYNTTEDRNTNIVLVEYPAIYRNSIPVSLLKQADVNILITNAQRVWKTSDDEFIKYLNDMVGDAPLFIYLNNATRETVEDFTGQLPPETSVRTVATRVMYMGLTSGETAVK